MNLRRYPKGKIVLVRPLRFRIEKLIGRRWWLGRHLWEVLDRHRGDCNHKFFSRRTLRSFNIGRKSRGWSLQSPIQRRKQFDQLIKF
jgi:hypothetical protein